MISMRTIAFYDYFQFPDLVSRLVGLASVYWFDIKFVGFALSSLICIIIVGFFCYYIVGF
ncbi:hypothetical protein KFK09_007865 [Dendrobium nobile]|uniref:Uncharacterized protein n=1 Tax=Dendrobium nobile TaxID=94219 RepID=A0A8T3BY17_DENNO|nr:hypothetical protein KFK09_007865 [Dendrobium nobile]